MIRKGNEIIPVDISKEIRKSYLDYAMSVIVSRALPDVRDGLKPVQRRILYSMQDSGYVHNKPHKKSARIVGDVLGKYHPHGDAAIYETMVRMAQDFIMNMSLIDGQGNWGSIDGDKAAAARYTEAKLTEISKCILEDYNNNSIDYEPNYDNTLQMPSVLPARFPNILINGANGIAVGMATSIPPHNLGEVIDATCALIDNEDIELSELLHYMPGPDFPTSGILVNLGNRSKIYSTGHGSMVLRAKHIIETKEKRKSIIVTEIPYQVNKSKLVEKIAELINDKVIEGVHDLRDESNRHGIRIVIELKKDAESSVILNRLFSMSQLQVSINFNMLAIHEGKPVQMGLKDILSSFITFRKDVVKRRSQFFLNKYQEKIHVLFALLVAIFNIDDVISLIRSSKDYNEALNKLVSQKWKIDNNIGKTVNALSNIYELDEIQAKGILDLRLHKLTSLEMGSLMNDVNDIKEQINIYTNILNDENELISVIKNELLEVRQKFAYPRKTELNETDINCSDEALIKKEDMVVITTISGYIKSVKLSEYKVQKRGGKGKGSYSVSKPEDVISQMFVANTHTDLLFFSQNGFVYKKKVYELPTYGIKSRGKAIINIMPIHGSDVSTIMSIDFNESIEGKYMVFVTKRGLIKKNKLSDFYNIRSNGKKAIKMHEEDKLISVLICDDNKDVMINTAFGKSVRFPVASLRVMSGRDSYGVKGINIVEKDAVVSVCMINNISFTQPEKEEYLRCNHNKDIEQTNSSQNNELINKMKDEEEFILAVSSKGFGKITSSYQYRTINRGGKGVIAMDIKESEKLVDMFAVNKDDHIMIVTSSGKIIRCSVNDIRVSSRNTHGVTLCKVGEDEKIIAVTKLNENVEEGEEHLG